LLRPPQRAVLQTMHHQLNSIPGAILRSRSETIDTRSGTNQLIFDGPGRLEPLPKDVIDGGEP
jgi:hypothetical protein